MPVFKLMTLPQGGEPGIKHNAEAAFGCLRICFVFYGSP